MNQYSLPLKESCEVELEGRFGKFVLRSTFRNAQIRRSRYALIIKSIKIVEPVENMEPLHVCYSLDSIIGYPRKIIWYEDADAKLRSFIYPAFREAKTPTGRTPYLLVVSKQSYDYLISTSRYAHAPVLS